MKFKKVYVEITNNCNLNCPFCLKTKRKKKNMSFDEFKHVINQIKPYTDYIYLHVLGEPLLHPNSNELIDYANSVGINVNITTNGYLINNLKTTNIRQVNISLHSFNDQYKLSLRDYLDNLFKFEDECSSKTYINYRLWVDNKHFENILNILEDHYKIHIDKSLNNIKLKDNVFLNFSHRFNWPQDSRGDDFYSGKCYALTDHIAILSDGMVTACCLDGDGVLSFGNIFEKDLKDIIQSEKFLKMKNELKNGIRSNPMCQKCNFLYRD